MTVIEYDTCEVCGHRIDEFEDHGFGRLMIGRCDDCSDCVDDRFNEASDRNWRRGKVVPA